ncbi:MAG: hypothetical protein HYZ38_19575 [Mycobacterium sp.]|nr:hypothetical protein [Mycobacterium sp.]
MSTVATTFNNGLTRFKVSTAAVAVAAAATLTPAVVAQAAPDMMPSAPAISNLMEAPAVVAGGFAQDWIWFGPTKPNGPNLTPVLAFSPLALVPGFLQPLFGWYKNIRFTACVFGVTLRIGPYGTLTAGYSKGC